MQRDALVRAGDEKSTGEGRGERREDESRLERRARSKWRTSEVAKFKIRVFPATSLQGDLWGRSWSRLDSGKIFISTVFRAIVAVVTAFQSKSGAL